MPLAEIDWNRLLRPDLIWVVIPIVAIVFHSVRVILERSNQHAERMEMIKRGMHPDDPSASNPPQNPTLAEGETGR